MRKRSSVGEAKRAGSRWFIAASCCLLSLALAVVGGAAYYELRQIRQMLSEKGRESLETLFNTRMILLAQWTTECHYRLRTTAELVGSSIGRAGNRGWQGMSDGERNKLLLELEDTAKRANFVAAGLADRDGRWIPGSLCGDRDYWCERPEVAENCTVENPAISNIKTSPSGKMALHWAIPFEALRSPPNEAPLLVLVADPNRKVFGLVRGFIPIYSSLDAILFQSNDNRIWQIFRFRQESQSLTAPPKLDPGETYQVALSGNIFPGRGIGPKGNKVLFHVGKLPRLPWGLIVMIDETEVMWPMKPAIWASWAVALLAFLVGGAVITLLWHRRLLSAEEESRDGLESLMKKVLTAHEEEREHLSHEIHDELAQLLFAADAHITVIERSTAGSPTDEVGRSVGALKVILDRAGSACRSVISQLQPPAIDDLGLPAAISKLAEQTLPEITEMIVENPERLQALTQETKIVLFRIAQEAMQNVKKHARAKRVQICLGAANEKVVMSIEDDGVGFRPYRASRGDRFGIAGMKERAHLAGGLATVISEPGRGTKVAIELPLGEG